MTFDTNLMVKLSSIIDILKLSRLALIQHLNWFSSIACEERSPAVIKIVEIDPPNDAEFQFQLAAGGLDEYQ